MYQLGLIPQALGKLTHARFWGSVLFVDNYSDFLYNHHLTSIKNLSTLNGKHAYEKIVYAHGVDIKSYHADN